MDFRMICTPLAIPISWLDKLFEAVEFLVVFLIPFLVLCWCYSHVALIMWGRSPSVVALNFSPAQQSFICQNKRRVTRTSALVAVTFIVCWLPTFVLSVVRTVSGTESVHRGHLLPEIAMFGTFINEATNPIIYCAFDRSLKARVSLRRICPHLTESAGSSQNANQTNYIANEHILNQAYVRNLHVILQSNQPHDNSARNTVNTAESREMVIVDRD